MPYKFTASSFPDNTMQATQYNNVFIQSLFSKPDSPHCLEN